MIEEKKPKEEEIITEKLGITEINKKEPEKKILEYKPYINAKYTKT